MHEQPMQGRRAVIIGAGPAGLTAAHELNEHGVPTVVLEADKVVGGIARTVNYKGYLFDIGGHRFFTKWPEVKALWNKILGDQFLERPRLSRIFYRKKFFYYPLRPTNALFGLGLGEALRIVSSYAYSRFFPYQEEENLEQWVSNRFGKRLYTIFFKTYTEKVWGVPCTDIRAEWAAQRIKGLSLTTAVRNALFPQNRPKVKTLIDKFHYPQRGPGQMWELLTERLEAGGCPVKMERQVVKICHDGAKVTRVVTRGPQGEESFPGTDFISSMPIRELVRALDPPAPEPVRNAAERLRYRDFLIVSLVLDRRDVAPDNWIYVHEPGVKVGRIQNFKNWSPHMVPDPSKTCLGMEYFVFENDELWASADDKLVEMAKRELVQLGLARREEIIDGTVVRMPKAYPMYDANWSDQVETIRRWIESTLPNLQLVGRNGMHKYNNQDHSMMTALYAARNILGEQHDLWAVNTEADYHEEEQEEKPAEERRPAYAEPPRVAPAVAASNSVSAKPIPPK